jgi:hypothetical protein
MGAMKATTLVPALATTLWLSTAALAEPATPQQVLPNIFSTSHGASLEVRGDYTNVQDTDGLTLIGLDAQFQYILPSNVGVYVSLPFGYASGNNDSASGIGNLELGGLYVIRKPDLDIYLRGGLALNTASNDGTFLAPTANIIPRLADAFPTGEDSSWLRAHAGIRTTSGVVRFGGTAGFDFALDDNNEDGLLVLNGAIGVVQPGFGISGGLTYLQLLGRDVGDDNTLGFNATVDFNAGATAKLFFALGVNLDNDFDGFSLGFGARIGL